MKSLAALIGLLAALALSAAGMLLLPAPETGGAAGIFAALWLLITMLAVVAFGREALRGEKLYRVRKSMRGSAGSRAFVRSGGRAAAYTRGEFIRQRARRFE